MGATALSGLFYKAVSSSHFKIKIKIKIKIKGYRVSFLGLRAPQRRILAEKGFTAGLLTHGKFPSPPLRRPFVAIEGSAGLNRTHHKVVDL